MRLEKEGDCNYTAQVCELQGCVEGSGALIIKIGAPGWLSWLGDRLRLRS